MFSDLLLCADRFKKKIEGVKLLGLREFGHARWFGGYLGGGGGYVKKQMLWGVRKETEILGGYQNLSRHGKKLLFINAAARRKIPLQ